MNAKILVLSLFQYLTFIPHTFYSQCPSVEVEFEGQTISYCDGMNSDFMDLGLPCNPSVNYITAVFTTQGGIYEIYIESQSNYTAFPNSPINVGNIGILNECSGELIFYSGAFACEVGWQLLDPEPNGNFIASQQWLLSLDLPAGEYIAVLGFWAAVGNPYQTFGCIHYTFGQTTFLDNTQEYVPLIHEQDSILKNTPKRYQRKVIEGRGLLLHDTYTDEYYDITTRKVVLSKPY